MSSFKQDRLLSLHCDSKGALARWNKYFDGTTGRCRTDYDLEVAIRTCILKLPIPITGIESGSCESQERSRFTFPELHETADEL
jgi:hypothetical protein